MDSLSKLVSQQTSTLTFMLKIKHANAAIIMSGPFVTSRCRLIYRTVCFRTCRLAFSPKTFTLDKLPSRLLWTDTAELCLFSIASLEKIVEQAKLGVDKSLCRIHAGPIFPACVLAICGVATHPTSPRAECPLSVHSDLLCRLLVLNSFFFSNYPKTIHIP